MYTKVLGYIKAGKDEGARCLAGGDKLGDKGYYIKPTIFADVKDNMKIAREEVSAFYFRIESYTYLINIITLVMYCRCFVFLLCIILYFSH